MDGNRRRKESPKNSVARHSSQSISLDPLQAVPKPGLQRVRRVEGAADILAFGGWRAYVGSLAR